MAPQVNSHKHEQQEDPDEQKSFWGIRCEGGKGYSRVLSRRCNMTMAALEPNTSRAENPWLSLMMERDGSQFLLCSLKHDAIMQVPLNLIFEKGEKIKFYVRGQGTVHLSGYQEGSSTDAEVNETDQKDDVEEDYSTLGKTIKNGQIFCEICDTFIKSEPFWRKHIQKKKHSKNVKLGKFDKSSGSPKNNRNNPSTSNAVTHDDEDSSEIEELPSNIPSGSSGKAVPVMSLLSKSLVKTLTQSNDEDEDDEEEDKDFNVFDEEESDEDDEDSDDDVEEDDDDSDDSGDMVNKALEAQKRKRESEALDSRKRMKKNNSISEASTSEASQMPVEIFEVEDDEKEEEEDDDSSSEEESDDSNENASSSFKKSPLIKNAQTLNKKKKSNDSVRQMDLNSKPNSGKADDSFQVQDLRVGYGPPAKAGKMVQVFYTGKFLDGRIFDQTEAGKPFSFKLGAGQVIKGWDMGIEGMKVGGKRKIRIPPHLGYGNKEMEDIPANSTLLFFVELKSIS
ncbi:46 kDa FK506-binding nuclear protein-like [Uloborus diversus]|uniref:46 kDa FK506-binding nuclear protein-like n=1 Tax=Uloborus diversus TaxID=327109 RepID=UPI002409DF31|nr:46 kDa FK506-binding nuclear protein-like [Uloborus diversus]